MMADVNYARDIERRRQGLPSAALATSRHDLLAPTMTLRDKKPPSILKVEKTPVKVTIAEVLAKEASIISAAQARIAAIQANPAKPVKRISSRRQERQIAALTGERIGPSRTIESEPASEDEENEILREVRPAIACHNLMNPKRKLATSTKDGYTRNAFVAESSTDTEEDDDDTDDDDSDESSNCEEKEHDDDPSPDYTSSSSPARPSAEQWQLFLKFQKAEREKSHPRELPSANDERLKRSERQIQESQKQVQEMLQTLREPKENELDTHGRVPRKNLPTFDVALHSPLHCDWENFDHLMKIV